MNWANKWYKFMEIWEKIKHDMFWFVIVFMLVSLLIIQPMQLHFFPDDTDGRSLSNMRPHVDALTGCQYLSVAGGGITPRMDEDHKQICKKQQP